MNGTEVSNSGKYDFCFIPNCVEQVFLSTVSHHAVGWQVSPIGRLWKKALSKSFKMYIYECWKIMHRSNQQIHSSRFGVLWWDTDLT